MDYVGLITFSLYITTFISPIRKLANFAEMFSNGFAGLHRFIELMATEPTIQDAPDAVELSQVRARWSWIMSASPIRAAARSFTTSISPWPRGDGGHRWPLRRRQEHPVPAGTPVL